VETDDPDVYYLQSQNGNVYSSRFFEGTPDPSEFETLRPDIPSEIPWCSEAFGIGFLFYFIFRIGSST
jgi:jumonji domain-containing protein 7